MKIIIFGIDGGTWKVINDAIDNDCMPFLESLIESGMSCTLKSIIPSVTPAAWSSFQTGCNPGRHGIINFSQYDEYLKHDVMPNANYLKNTIWEVVSRNNKKVGVINVPMTYPPKKVNGYIVSGMMTPSIESNFTHPINYKKEVIKILPEYSIFNLRNVINDYSHNDVYKFVRSVNKILENRLYVSMHTINKEPIDLFMVHFQVSDIVQHRLWNYLDEEHPYYNEDMNEYILSNFYRRIDHCMYNIYQYYTNNDDCMCIVMSDHGFCKHSKRFNLGNWLVNNGYENDVYSIGRSSEGFIHILNNIDVDALIDNIYEIVDDELIVKNVYRKEDIYHGDRLCMMPDLVVDMIEGYSCTSYRNNSNKMFEDIDINSDFHVGKHDINGMLVVHGDGITSSALNNVNIMDIYPTVLKYMNIDIPDFVDGSSFY